MARECARVPEHWPRSHASGCTLSGGVPEFVLARAASGAVYQLTSHAWAARGGNVAGAASSRVNAGVAAAASVVTSQRTLPAGSQVKYAAPSAFPFPIDRPGRRLFREMKPTRPHIIVRAPRYLAAFAAPGGTAAITLLFLLAPGHTLAQMASSRWDVVEAGATADGTADCTAIFQKLLEAAGQAGGGIVTVPAGRFRIDGHLSVPANVTLQGVFRVPPTPTRRPGSAGDLTGSVLLAREGRGSAEGPPFIQLAGNNAAIAGVVVTYPAWRQADVPPVPYPPCVLSQDTENVGISECCFLNPYEAIKLVRAARHLVRNVTGYPIKRGLFVDECYDIGHIENVHFWPFGVAYQPEDPYCKWINTQGVAFELARTDWHYVHNTFCFGYGVGYKFSESRQGSANGNFLGLGADSCQRAVVVEQAQAPGLLIANGEFVGRWGSTDSVCLVVGPKVEGKVSLVNCSFWGPIDRCVWMQAPAGQVTASACNFVHWDNSARGSPAIQLDAGRAIVQGCTFDQDKLDVAAGANVVSALLLGNQAEGGFRVKNQAGKRVQLALNEEDSIEWTDAARRHYELQVGSAGDGRYLENWHGSERAERSWRWSTANSRLHLPVAAGKPCTISLVVQAPAPAISSAAGLYYQGERVAPLLAGTTRLIAQLPGPGADAIELELRCQGWVPQKSVPGSGDPRTLGVQVYKVEVQSADAGTNVFNANSGKWIEKR